MVLFLGLGDLYFKRNIAITVKDTKVIKIKDSISPPINVFIKDHSHNAPVISNPFIINIILIQYIATWANEWFNNSNKLSSNRSESLYHVPELHCCSNPVHSRSPSRVLGCVLEGKLMDFDCN